MHPDSPSFFDLAALLLVLASAIGCINHLYWHLPRAIAILGGSLLLSMLALGLRFAGFDGAHWVGDRVTSADLPHLFLDGALAFLLFAGTLNVDLGGLRRNMHGIFLLSSASVILATLVFGFGMWFAARAIGSPIPLGWWIVLGAALAPTDAVVVNSLLRNVPVPDSLRALISGESLFNDGAGVVMFLIALGLVGGGKGLYGHGQVLIALVHAAVGGAAIGGAAGWISGQVIRRVHDDGVRLMVTLALVLGSYRLASTAGVSGPIAVVTAGLVLTREVPRFASTTKTGLVAGFWAMLDELLDTLLFLLLGLQTLSLTVERTQILLAAASVLVALLSRLVSVALPVSLNERPFRPRPRGIALLTWGGMRGGVSVALALTVPHTRYQPALLFICYVVVVSSILLQGLTMPRVSAWLFKQQGGPDAGSSRPLQPAADDVRPL